MKWVSGWCLALWTECWIWGCRCSERLLLGDAFISTAGAADLELANLVAREMVYKCGFSRRLGPVALMDSQTGFLRGHGSETMADIGTELAAIALTDIKDVRYSGHLTNIHLFCKLPRHGAAVLCVQPQKRALLLFPCFKTNRFSAPILYSCQNQPCVPCSYKVQTVLFLQLVEGAEAKAMFGLAVNYKPLQALVETLERDEVLTGGQVADILEANGAARFPDPFVEGFGFDENSKLVYPGMPKEVRPACRGWPICYTSLQTNMRDAGSFGCLGQWQPLLHLL